METKSHIQKTLTEINKRLQHIELKLGNALPEEHKWTDHQEICQTLNISKRTLDNYRERGLLPYSKIGGKVYYRPGDINDYLNKHIVKKEGRS